jgi:hypothetical protein
MQHEQNMQEHPNSEHAQQPASKAVRALTRDWLILQLSLSPSEAAYPGVEHALDRAAQALAEARLLASGFLAPAAGAELK